MIKLFLPLVLLVGILLIRQIPRIGGNALAAFLVGGITALITGGISDPRIWAGAWFETFDSISYAAWIILLGSIFAGFQKKKGSIDLVLDILRVLFGQSAQGLVAAVMITLFFSGAVMGTTLAAAATIGIIVVPLLNDMKLKPEMICAMCLSGASMGSIMPPVSNSVVFAAGMMGIDALAAIRKTYLSVGLGLVVVCFIFSKIYVGKKYRLPEELIPKEKISDLLKSGWKKLIPIGILFLLTALASIPVFSLDVLKLILEKLVGTTVWRRFALIPILGKLTNTVVLALVLCSVISFFMSGGPWKERIETVASSCRTVKGTLLLTVVMAFFIASYTAGGQVELIMTWASGLSGHMLIWGGAILFLFFGMLLGSQANSMALLIPIFAPAFMGAGISEVNTCAAISHLAMAGQGMPPADTNAFAIAGIVEGVLHKKVNAQKAMLYSLPYCIYLAVAGLAFCYL